MGANDAKSNTGLTNYSELVFPRKIIFGFLVSSLIAIILFIVFAFEINKWAVERNEKIFNGQQALQVLLAKQALEENIYEFQYDIEILQMYFRQILVGKDETSLGKDGLFQFLQTSRQEILTFLVTDSENNLLYSNTSVGQRSKDAKFIAESWIKKYWLDKDNWSSRSFVPPVYISRNLQLLGYLVPVWVDGEQKGIFCVVIDLQPMIHRFIFPMGMGNYGTGRFLNQDGLILFDDNVLNIGKNISEVKGFDSDLKLKFEQNIVNSEMGQGELFVPGVDGDLERRIAAWHSMKIGTEKLILLLTATEEQVSSALLELHVQINVLGILLVGFIILINFVLIYSRKKIVQDSARNLEDLVEKRTAELAMSEIRYQAIFHSVNDALFIVEKNLIINFNKKALSMFGYSEDEMKKLSPYDISVLSREEGGSVMNLRSYVRKALLGTPQSFEWIQIRKDGSRFESELNLSAVLTGNKKMLLSVVRDNTQRKKNEKEIRELNTELEGRVWQRTLELENANTALSESLKELKQTQKSLVEAEKMASLGVLVAGVAHEINTPVGVGVTAASHLKQQTLNILKRYSAGDIRRSELEDYISTADESASVILENLNKASDHIKSFKNVAVDQASKEKRKFLLKEYISDVIMSLNPVIRETRHQVVLTGEDELEVESVPGSVSQVVTNLVMNSLKHAFDGIEKGHITIDISREKGKAVVDYSDDGNGMREEILIRIFDPFFTTKRGSGGSGLGMHIVYNLVTRSLGGEIECRSSVGRGTKILIKIPLGTK